jgi:hypothetical protein
MQSGGMVKAIVPQSMEEAYRLGKAICMAGMAPKGLDTPEKAMIAIMQGMEVGMTPMASLQRIAVVNGRPTIWGDGAMSLVRGSGLCEWVREAFEGQGETRTAICTVKRKGEPEDVKRTFSVADAKKAGLWGKSGPWQQYPDRMLQMRARAFALRDVFADVLGGMYLREEIEEDRQPRDITPTVRPQPPRPPAPPVAVVEVIEEHTDENAQQDAFDVGAFLSEIEDSLATAKDAETVAEIYNDYDVDATLESAGRADMIDAARQLRDRFLLKFTPLAGG